MSEKNPVLLASTAVARAARYSTPDKVAEAKRALTEAKLRRAIEQAIASAPPLTDEQRESLAALLIAGGAK